MKTIDLLECLDEALQRGAPTGRGGVVLVRIDRARMLRDQLGFTGLAALSTSIVDRVRQLSFSGWEALQPDSETLLLILPDLESDAFRAAAEAIFSQLSDRVYPAESGEIALTVSLAHARFDHRFTGVDDLLLPLVRQVEQIEAAGGNAMGEALPGISARKAMDSNEHMLGLLMEALQTDSIRVVFQPLLATNGHDQAESYQMLPRLVAGDGTLIAAAEFLPLAREASLLPVVDRWMTMQAVRLLRGKLRHRDLRLFINQSEVLLADAERREWLDRQFASDPALAGHMVVELPLEDAMAHMRGARHLLGIARQRGFGICLSHIDDHSRWELLTGDLKPDFVRMAAGFVSRLTHEPSLEKRFATLAEPVRAQGTRIIMPMIEDSETAASMWRSGADYMQGNMIQAPEDSIAG